MTEPLNPPPFRLTPPEVVVPVPETAAQQALPLPDGLQSAVDAQVEQFVAGLLTENLRGEDFRAKLDSAFALGREEITQSASLMQGHFLQRNFVGVEDSPAFAAIQAMRRQLDELHPGRQGDLLQPQKILGLIPYGNKLQAYFRKYQSAASQLQTCMQQIYAARDDMQRDGVALDLSRQQMWEAMQKLGAAIRFAQALDRHLADKVETLKATDPERSKALEQEVLFYSRQNLQDMLTQLSVCTNGYLALDVLKKTGREMINGCNRVATTGMSALAVAQTVARATGNQVKVMAMLEGVNATVNDLIAETGRQLNQHVERTVPLAQDPLVGIEKLQLMFDQTFQAMDAMDTFRHQAIEAMGQNNTVIKAQLARAEHYIDRARQDKAREATPLRAGTPGPVAL